MNRVLVVDDDPQVSAAFAKYLARSGYVVRQASGISAARQLLAAEGADAILLDLGLPDGNGLELIVEMREQNPHAVIVVITGACDIALAVEAMRKGADNFLVKPANIIEVELFLKRHRELASSGTKGAASTDRPAAQMHFGTNPAMIKVREMAQVAAACDSPVMLLGETGTGKGMLARWIHDNGPRRGRPFVELNCSTIKGDLLASELFGHVKGAFTSAFSNREGLVEAADGGTLFLDEIGDMDISVQPQFLKLLEEKQYRRLGDSRVRRSDFRLICATNRDIENHVTSGMFRRDIYYRICVLPVSLPSLRERADDLPGLIDILAAQVGADPSIITDEIRNAFLAYDWPGNIRELKNTIERVSLFSRSSLSPVEMLPFLTRQTHAGGDGVTRLRQLQDDHIRSVLLACGRNVNKASSVLGISRATLYRKLKSLDLL